MRAVALPSLGQDHANQTVQLREQSRKLELTEWGPPVILRRENFISAMSHMGHSRHSPVSGMSAVHPKATTQWAFRNRRFVPKASKMHRNKPVEAGKQYALNRSAAGKPVELKSNFNRSTR
jgi:hypothetical protein